MLYSYTYFHHDPSDLLLFHENSHVMATRHYLKTKKIERYIPHRFWFHSNAISMSLHHLPPFQAVPLKSSAQFTSPDISNNNYSSMDKIPQNRTNEISTLYEDIFGDKWRRICNRGSRFSTIVRKIHFDDFLDWKLVAMVEKRHVLVLVSIALALDIYP